MPSATKKRQPRSHPEEIQILAAGGMTIQLLEKTHTLVTERSIGMAAITRAQIVLLNPGLTFQISLRNS